MTEVAERPAPAPPSRHPGLRGNPALTLAAISLGVMMVALDGTVVSVANPTIQRDLGATLAGLQWVTNGYLLALAVLLIPGGKLGDRFGRRRIFAIGIAGFALASLGLRAVLVDRGARLLPRPPGRVRRDADAQHAGDPARHVPARAARARGRDLGRDVGAGGRIGPDRRGPAGRAHLVGVDLPAEHPAGCDRVDDHAAGGQGVHRARARAVRFPRADRPDSRPVAAGVGADQGAEPRLAVGLRAVVRDRRADRAGAVRDPRSARPLADAAVGHLPIAVGVGGNGAGDHRFHGPLRGAVLRDPVPAEHPPLQRCPDRGQAAPADRDVHRQPDHRQRPDPAAGSETAGGRRHAPAGGRLLRPDRARGRLTPTRRCGPGSCASGWRSG